MKKTILLTGLTFIFFYSIAFGQVPQGINYQAVLHDTDGVIKNEMVTLNMSILRDTPTGDTVYAEEHTKTTNEYGLVNLVIGQGTTTEDFSTINWSNGPYYIKTEVNGIEMSTQQLMSVPYALYALNAESTDDRKEIMDIIITLQNGAMDYEGNQYEAVLIGEQIWMAENLRSTRYSDGTPITQISDSTAWANLDKKAKAYCYLNDDSASNASQGVFYTGTAASRGDSSNTNPSGVQGICPEGWHLPSDAEWYELEFYLGLEDIEGDREGLAKDIKSTSGWEPDENGTNKTKMNIKKYYNRDFDGVFYNHTFYWTSTIDESNNFGRFFARDIRGYNSYIGPTVANKDFGLPIRCVKDLD